MYKKLQSGFGVIEIILVIAVVGVVVLVGLHIYQTQQVVSQFNEGSTVSTQKARMPVSSTATVAPAINNSNDLQTAIQTLDSTSDQTSAPADIDAQLNF